MFIDEPFVRGFESTLAATGDNVTLEHYVTTVLHAVELLFHSPSIAPAINLTITHWELLDADADPASHRHGYATQYLKQFCLLQREHSNRSWDHAILLTGYDLHRGGGGPDILKGRAQFGQMCSSRHSCSIAEALELDSPYLIAHELGHSLGMDHDETAGCASDFLMSAGLGAGKLAWSACSQVAFNTLVEKLNRRDNNCLELRQYDQVRSIPREQLPGQLFDEDAQCRFDFRKPDIRSRMLRHIRHPEGVCHMLWCATGPYVRHYGAHPALEGTYCGDSSWCRGGRCLPFLPPPHGPVVVQGAWSHWTQPDGCTNNQTCRCPPIAEAKVRYQVAASHTEFWGPGPLPSKSKRQKFHKGEGPL